MKKITAFLLVLFMLSLTACAVVEDKKIEDEKQESSETVSNELNESFNDSSADFSDETSDNSYANDGTSSETVKPFEPYVVKISRADFPIYKGVGYEYGFACYVEKASAYTIVEEAEDSFGNLWGKLKSGAGWVDLTQLNVEEARGPVLTLLELTDDILNNGNYIYCPASDSEYAAKILLKANVQIAKIEFFPMEISDTLKETSPEYTKKNCAAGAYILVDISLPGDISEYGIRVTDMDGFVYRYSVFENLSGEGDLYNMHTYAP